MSTTAIPPRSQSRPSARSRTKLVPQGPNPTRAFGFLLDKACITRFAEQNYEKVYGTKVSYDGMSEEEAEDMMEPVFFATVDMLPLLVYRNIPHLPRLRRRIILMDDVQRTFLFALKDDSSSEALKIQITPEDLEETRRTLTLGDQQPNWYYVSI